MTEVFKRPGDLMHQPKKWNRTFGSRKKPRNFTNVSASFELVKSSVFVEQAQESPAKSQSKKNGFNLFILLKSFQLGFKVLRRENKAFILLAMALMQ